jgi:hypothetical protein
MKFLEPTIIDRQLPGVCRTKRNKGEVVLASVFSIGPPRSGRSTPVVPTIIFP